MNIIKKLINWFKTVPVKSGHILFRIFQMVPFFFLLIIFMYQEAKKIFLKLPIVGKLLNKITLPFLSKRSSLLEKVVNKIEAIRPFQVKRYYLINLAYDNLKIKKTRSLITILGMSIGVGIIVYLLSLGYGIERLVISKVARLDELRIADVLPGETSESKLTKAVLQKIQKIKFVQKTIPVVSIVGKINYKNAKIDILTYAITDEYTKITGQQLIKGQMFADNGKYLSMNTTEVLGADLELKIATDGSKISNQNLVFNIHPEKPIIARETCNIQAKILGFATRINGNYQGYEYWGSSYSPYFPSGRIAFDKKANKELGVWVKSKVPLFNKLPNDNYQPVLNDDGKQDWSEVCFKKADLYIYDRYAFGEVLGESTESATISATDSALTTSEIDASDSANLATNNDVYTVATSSGGVEFVSLQATDSAFTKPKSEFLSFESEPKGEAVISSGMANLLGIPKDKIIGIHFKVSFILVRNLLEKATGRMITKEVDYKVVGMVDDLTKEYFYIPLSDIQKAGVRNYSQLKVIALDQRRLSEIRKDVEVLGLKTTSAVDTVIQIESLFGNLRIFLGLLGAIALGVAALGMFNTLTVSLLERTREIGGMKAMGMVSREIEELFLSEAIIIGFAGGLGGLLLGFLGGQLTSFLISIFAIIKGTGYLQVSYIPPALYILIIIASFIIGLLTGVYPSIRAKKISALNALRYE